MTVIAVEEAWCKLLVAVANRWVREARLGLGNRGDYHWAGKSTSDWRAEALRDFSEAVTDPSTSWIVVEVARLRNMPQRTILNALLDRARLPRDYHYETEGKMLDAA